MTLLKQGSFYWVQYSKLELAPDGRTKIPSAEVSQTEPARYTGLSGGSPPTPTWDFLGQPSAEEMAVVRWIGPEIIA